MNNQQEVMHAKECLKRGLPIPPDSVRDVILESWQRCKAQDVPMEHGDKGVLPHQAVEQRIAQRQPFCQVAVPYLDVLYNFIRGSNFLVILSDEEGYLLYERGDPEILDIARQNALVKGPVAARPGWAPMVWAPFSPPSSLSRSLPQSTTMRYIGIGPALGRLFSCPTGGWAV